MANVKGNTDNLNKILKSIKKDCKLRVGIVGSTAKAQHKDSSLTNAELGAVHEFGADIDIPAHNISVYRSITKDGYFRFGGQFQKKNKKTTNWQEDYHISEQTINIPRRSFLEDPLKKGFNFKKDDMKPLKKSAWENVFVKNSPEKFFNDLGEKALDIIRASWGAGGNPKWQSLTASTKRQKAKKGLSPNTLVGSGELMNTISFKVIKK